MPRATLRTLIRDAADPALCRGLAMLRLHEVALLSRVLAESHARG